MPTEQKSGTERMLEFAKNWTIPIVFFAVTATSSATATLVLGRQEQKTLAHEISDVREQVQRLDACLERLEAAFYSKHAVGLDGFLDDVLHGRMDRHLEHWAVEKLGRTGWRRLQQEYSTTANGTDR